MLCVPSAACRDVARRHFDRLGISLRSSIARAVRVRAGVRDEIGQERLGSLSKRLKRLRLRIAPAGVGTR
jgi:hypothetical protein